MSDENEDKIRERAFAIWEAQGHPEGMADAHWSQAAAELGETPESEELPNPLATGAAAKSLTGRKRETT